MQTPQIENELPAAHNKLKKNIINIYYLLFKLTPLGVNSEICCTS